MPSWRATSSMAMSRNSWSPWAYVQRPTRPSSEGPMRKHRCLDLSMLRSVIAVRMHGRYDTLRADRSGSEELMRLHHHLAVKLPGLVNYSEVEDTFPEAFRKLRKRCSGQGYGAQQELERPAGSWPWSYAAYLADPTCRLRMPATASIYRLQTTIHRLLARFEECFHPCLRLGKSPLDF